MLSLAISAFFLTGGAAAFFQSFLQPTGPISVERQNFAAPDHPDLVVLNEDPPVYEIPGFLSDDECRSIIDAAESGTQLPPIPYGRKNKIFTGRKWAVGSPGAKFLCPAAMPFFERACRAFGDVPATRFEPVTVTRYEETEYQAQHLDARLPHEVNRNAAFMRAGGQRIAQLIVYLQPPERGGETKFFRSAFSGLAVRPETGKALIFPTATRRGEADERYLHSGEPVLKVTKWIMGTWLMEQERCDGEDVASAIDEMWRLAGKHPPSSP
jgi:prolyl 4-hydroxylase